MTEPDKITCPECSSTFRADAVSLEIGSRRCPFCSADLAAPSTECEPDVLSDLLREFRYTSSRPGRGERALSEHHVRALAAYLSPRVSVLSRGARPTKPELMMNIARQAARRSTCARLHVGAVVADPALTTILSIGYNGNAAELENACDDPDAPGACGCLHAEENALDKAPYDRGPVALFTTHFPCPACCKRVLNHSVRWVYYAVEYRDPSGREMLERSGIGVARSLEHPPFFITTDRVLGLFNTEEG